MKIQIIILSLLVFSSCDNVGRFEVPQPEEQRDEKSIPKKLWGIYLNLEDSSMITIGKGQIVKIVKTSYSGLLSDLDSADRVVIKGDTIFSEVDANLAIDIVTKGDSIFQNMNYADTLFSFSNDNILRKFKGYYFLNKKTGLGTWSVTKLGITKDGIVLGRISNKEDLEKLRELTNAKADTVYNFRPTKKQLWQFVKDKGFQNEVRFVKIEYGRQ